MRYVKSFNAAAETNLKDDLLITLFMSHIEADSSMYYNNFFSTKLEYYDYETKIIDIKSGTDSQRKFIYITFGSTPMIGAHNPVGYDEISYRVDVLGNITLEDFAHLKSFEIPEWLRNGMIKPYPEKE